MRFVERVKAEWELQEKEHTPFKTFEEVEQITNANYAWAARIQSKLGRKLTEHEIEDLMM